MPNQPASTTPPPSGEKTGEVARSLVSLLLVVHLSCVGVALAANQSPSPLQERLVEVLAPYLQLLNLDLNFTPYYLTHETSLDTDHRIEVLPSGTDLEAEGKDRETEGPGPQSNRTEPEPDASDSAAREADSEAEKSKPGTDDAWYVLPDVGIRGSDRRHRYQRLAKIMDLYAEREERSGLIAERVAVYVLRQRGVKPAQVRCRRLELQTPESLREGSTAPQDPFDPSYFQTVYDAKVVFLTNGSIIMNRVESRGEVAPPGTSQD